MYNDEINALKILLAQTDYVALKVAEAEMYGEDTSEFVEVIEKRRAWRCRINELEEREVDVNEIKRRYDAGEDFEEIIKDYPKLSNKEIQDIKDELGIR